VDHGVPLAVDGPVDADGSDQPTSGGNQAVDGGVGVDHPGRTYNVHRDASKM
jgi:hypothetical protein